MKNKKSRMKFIIVSPRQYSGGAIVLHKLCKLIEEEGYNASIFYSMIPVEYYKKRIHLIWLYYLFYSIKDLIKLVITKIFKCLIQRMNNSRFLGYDYYAVKGCKRKYTPFYNKESTIVIYPESIYGNFLKSKHTIRWLLFYNPFKNDVNAFGKNEKFICYREIFNDNSLNPDCNTVCISNFDRALYRQTNFGKREGKCYIIRKGKDRKDLPSEFDGIIIDNLSEPKKNEVFNNCEYCISYDMQTFYTTIAALCGCKTICVPEEGKKRNDYVKEGEYKYGVAFGFSEEELKYAEKTKELINERINSIDERNKENMIVFISLCKKFFGEENFC